ncbi:MAG: hypothetical protein U1E13_11790, partial [Methylophilaceae bacterium]|nr:hypothetical protein [Methylophilaceae bacterium]
MKPIHMYLAASVIALSACSGEPSMSAFVGTYEKVQNEKDKRVFEILKKDGSLVIKGDLAEPDRYSLKRIFSTKQEEVPVFEAVLRPITVDEITDINRYETIRLKTSNTWVSKEHDLMITHFKDKDSEARFGSK